MKRRPFGSRFPALVLAIPAVLCLARGQEAVQEKAAAAVKAGDYKTAVRLCFKGLRQNHADYELNFLLGRAYAFSGLWDQAVRVLDDLALAHPENTDVLVFRARVKSWKKEYTQAESEYREVLRLSPGNSEALIGLAEIASWQRQFAKSLAIYGQVQEKEAANADVYFRLGRVYLWDGNYDEARANFERARTLDPQNREYRRMLRTATPRFRDQYELRTEYQAENFNDGRKGYIDRRLAFQFKVPSLGPLVFKANTTSRFQARDYQYGFELYPRLWSRAYACIDLAYSPKALYYPETSCQAEVYQGLPSSWEFSLGYRRLNFTVQPADIMLGSIGRYFGHALAFVRWFYTPQGEGEAFSWTLNLRRYFAASSYLSIAYGRGSKPFDIVSIEDYSVTRSWVFLTGLDWIIGQRIRVQFNYIHRDEGELRRDLFFAGAGLRW